jgi:hypothetical protein
MALKTADSKLNTILLRLFMKMDTYEALRSGQCVSEIVETVPNLVYKRDQLISHQVTVSTHF